MDIIFFFNYNNFIYFIYKITKFYYKKNIK